MDKKEVAYGTGMWGLPGGGMVNGALLRWEGALPGGRGMRNEKQRPSSATWVSAFLSKARTNPPESEGGIPGLVVCPSLCCPGIHVMGKASKESVPMCREAKFPLFLPYVRVSKFLLQMP